MSKLRNVVEHPLAVQFPDRVLFFPSNSVIAQTVMARKTNKNEHGSSNLANTTQGSNNLI